MQTNRDSFRCAQATALSPVSAEVAPYRGHEKLAPHPRGQKRCITSVIAVFKLGYSEYRAPQNNQSGLRPQQKESL